MLLLTPTTLVRTVLLFLALCSGLVLSAQNLNFAVRASVTILEASPYLEDYGRDGNLLVVLTNVDNSNPAYQGLLRITVQGNGYRAETRDLLAQPPIVFNFGQPVILRGSDLAPYFDLNNLMTEGIALDNTLGNGGALPDGPITICVEVYDVNRFTDPPVSNPACAVRFVQQHYPPELVNPLGEALTDQVLNFTWNPRHVPQPANDAYDLDIWEKVPGLTPDQIINSAPPVTPTITTFIPRYVFTNYDARLQLDKTYIWRVRVRDRRNIRTFVNDGYSRPGEFHFGEDLVSANCPDLLTFYGTGSTANNVGLAWALSDTAGVSGYNLRYRIAGTEDWASIPLPGTNLPAHTLSELTAGSNYEAELCAICTDGSTSCQKATFTTLEQDGDCGPLPYPTVIPVSDNEITLSWEANEAAAGYRLYWSSIIAPVTAPQQETAPEGRRRRNRGRRISPLRRTSPGTRAPSPASTSVMSDSLLLSAGSSSVEVNGLVAGTDYRFRFCQLCPDGSQTCYEWTVDFNGVDDGCLTSLKFTRPDSTDTTLDLAWTYDPTDIAATDSFTLIWQLADGSGPEIMATVAYQTAAFTIADRIPGQTYTLRVCAECTIAQPTCRDLPPFGGCVSEYLPELVDIADKRALIGWPVATPPAIPTQARYAMRSFLNWADLPTESFAYFNPDDHPFPGDQLAETPRLSTSVVYLGQVRTQCHDTLWSAWSEPVEFSTGCSVVDPLEAVAITDESATVLAVARANASYYQFYYRLQGTTENEWILLDNIDVPAIELTNLLADTVYQVKMRYWCNLGVWSDYTDVLDFRTLPPCGAPEDAAATELFETAARLDWGAGKNAVRATLNYRRFAAPPGNNQTTAAEASSQRLVDDGAEGAPGGNTPPPPNPGVGEWLVLENLVDNTFLDNLDGGARYVYRLQSDCEVNISEWSEIKEFTLLCAAPDDLSVGDITPFTARVTIDGLSPSAGTHEYSYRILGDTSWLSLTRSGTTATLQELDDLSTYEVRVRTRCRSGEFSGWSDTLQFETLVDCRVPTNLGVADMTTNSVDLRWDVTGTVTRWEIRFYNPDALQQQNAQQSAGSIGVDRLGEGDTSAGSDGPVLDGGLTPSGGGSPPGGGGTTPTSSNNPTSSDGPFTSEPAPPDPYRAWQSITTTDPTRTISGLSRSRKYKVVVRAECPTYGWTDFSEVLEFSHLCPQPVVEAPTADDIGFRDVTINWPALRPCLLQYRVAIESLEPLADPNTTTAPAGVRQGRGGPQSDYWSGSTPPPTIFRDSVTTLETNAGFQNLRPNTEYRYRVKGYFSNSVFDPGPNGYLTMSDGPFGAYSGVYGENAGADYVKGEPGWGDYSEWIVFRTDHCAAPYDLVETTLGRSTMELSWTASNGTNEFEVKYKLAEDAGSSWAYETVSESFIVLENLLTNAIYDYQVTEVCQDGESFRPAPRDTFIMKKPSLNNGFYACGLETDIDLANEIPLAELLEDDTIRAFDFPVVIVEVNGGNGYFSGVGEIRVPYFNKAKMQFEFDNIFVNDEYQMVGGCMEATGFGIEVLPPWADSLLADIIDGLESLDSMYAEQQVAQLDSLMQCCAAYLPPAIQDTIAAILDCYEQNPDPVAAGCQDRLDSLMVYITQNLDSIVEALDTQIVTSLTVDIIRVAMQELSIEHAPFLPDKQNTYAAAAGILESLYPVLPDEPGIPDYLLESQVLDPGSGGNSSLNQFGESAGEVQTSALALTLEDMFVNTEPKVPGLLALKDFALSLRTGDTDVFTPIHDGVAAIWYDPDGDPNFDQRPLIDQAKLLLATKYTFLVNE